MLVLLRVTLVATACYLFIAQGSPAGGAIGVPLAVWGLVMVLAALALPAERLFSRSATLVALLSDTAWLSILLVARGVAPGEEALPLLLLVVGITALAEFPTLIPTAGLAVCSAYFVGLVFNETDPLVWPLQSMPAPPIVFALVTLCTYLVSRFAAAEPRAEAEDSGEVIGAPRLAPVPGPVARRVEPVGSLTSGLRRAVSLVRLAADEMRSGHPSYEAEPSELLHVVGDNLESAAVRLDDLVALTEGIEAGPRRSAPAVPHQLLADLAFPFMVRSMERGAPLTVSSPPDLPEVAADGESVAHALAMILEGTFQRTAQGGRVELGACLLAGTVEFSISSDPGRDPAQPPAPIVGSPINHSVLRECAWGGVTSWSWWPELTVAAAIIQQEGGDLRFEASPRGSFRVSFRLPVESPRVEAEPRPAPRPLSVAVVANA